MKKVEELKKGKVLKSYLELRISTEQTFTHMNKEWRTDCWMQKKTICKYKLVCDNPSMLEYE